MVTKSQTIHPIYPEGKDCGELERDRVIKVAAESYRSIHTPFLNSSNNPLSTHIYTQFWFPEKAQNTKKLLLRRRKK